MSIPFVQKVRRIYLASIVVPVCAFLDVLLTFYEEALGAAIRESFTFSARASMDA